MTLAFRIRGLANAFEPKGFKYVTMNPPLPAKAVGPPPANVPLRNEVFGHTSFIATPNENIGESHFDYLPKLI